MRDKKDKIVSIDSLEVKAILEKFKTQILPNPKIKAIFDRLKDK